MKKLVKTFSFTNKAGGTGMSNWQWDEQFEGVALVMVVRNWDDYEIGRRYVGISCDKSLTEYLSRNASPEDQQVYFGSSDIVKTKLSEEPVWNQMFGTQLDD